MVKVQDLIDRLVQYTNAGMEYIANDALQPIAELIEKEQEQLVW